MARSRAIPVQNLCLDRHNFRTVPQDDELHALHAMIAVSPDRFIAVTLSLLQDGYLPIENIMVIEENDLLIVKEGNKRVGALKLILGLIPTDGLALPDDLVELLPTTDEQWKRQNSEIPCRVYTTSERHVVDKIVTLAHGKGEKAGRENWKAVARARHNREMNNASEPALDLLEKYLTSGKNLTPLQAERWAADYPLSVLADALKRTATRFGAQNTPDLAKKYPRVRHRSGLEAMLLSIGYGNITFRHIRSGRDFLAQHGVPPSTPEDDTSRDRGDETDAKSTETEAAGTEGEAGTRTGAGERERAGKVAAATAISDPRSVTAALKEFEPRGKERGKVVTLRDESLKLNVKKTPLAFSFLLRSMFEISAKAYCDEHAQSGGPAYRDSKGRDRRLLEVLKDIIRHLERRGADPKLLHAAKTELAQSERILSVTSMNQLVHNPSFSIRSEDLSLSFANVFPLLRKMNE